MIPELQLGKIMPKNRWVKFAPKLRAPSSNVFKSIEDITASTERTMNGNVNNTWPTNIKSQLVRKLPELP